MSLNEGQVGAYATSHRFLNLLNQFRHAHYVYGCLDLNSTQCLVATCKKVRYLAMQKPSLPCWTHIDEAFFNALPWMVVNQDQKDERTLCAAIVAEDFCGKFWEAGVLLKITEYFQFLRSANLLGCADLDSAKLNKFLEQCPELTHLCLELPWGWSDTSCLNKAYNLTHLHIDFHRKISGLSCANLRFLRIADVDPTDLHPQYRREWGITNILNQCPKVEEVVLGLKVAHISQADAEVVSQEMRRRPLRVSTRTRTAPVIDRVFCSACSALLYSNLSSYLLHFHPSNYVGLAIYTHEPPIFDNLSLASAVRSSHEKSPAGEERMNCCNGCHNASGHYLVMKSSATSLIPTLVGDQNSLATSIAQQQSETNLPPQPPPPRPSTFRPARNSRFQTSFSVFFDFMVSCGLSTASASPGVVAFQFASFTDNFGHGVQDKHAAICGISRQRFAKLDTVPGKYAPGT